LLALALVCALAAAVVAFSYDRDRRRERALERRERVWEQERKDLIDRIMYLTDKTWTIPPADMQYDGLADLGVPEPDEVSYDPLYSLPEEMR
jgi:hypothetical protein